MTALAVAGFGTLTFLPHSPDTASGAIRSLKDLADAYLKVQPGETRASQLAGLGFDSSSENVEVISYLGVMERFTTGSSTKFDHMDEALQDCIEARDHCTAYVYKAGEPRVQAAGLFGFGSASASAHGPEVTLVVENGRVAYKTITGMPATLLARHDAPAPTVRRPPAVAAAYSY